MSLDQIWDQTTTDQKLAFFRQLLDKQPDLRAQLLQFTRSQPSTAPIVFFTKADNIPDDGSHTIEAISTEVFEALSDLRFDDDGLEMDEEDYYSEELPDPTPLIESVLTDYAGQVGKAFREGRLTDAMTVYMGVYEGTQSATEPEADDYDAIDNYPEQTWEVWHELLTIPLRQLAERVLHPDQISRSLNQLAERVLFFDAQDAEDDTADDDDFYDEQAPEQIVYNLKSFEPLLLALVTDEPSARVVYQAINAHNWQKRGTEYVQLRIAEKLSDSGLWLQIADSFADQDQIIANWLLERRRQMGDLSVLLQTLYRLTNRFPRAFDAFILDHLDDTLLAPGPNLNLYLTALENRCRSAGQLTDYLKLRGFWTPALRRQFADSLATPYVQNALFYAQVLQTEGRTDDLFAWLKSLSWHYTQALPNILLIAAKTHPNECMDLAMERITGLLETGKRDRGMYQLIAGWLAALNTVQSLKPQVAIFASHLQTTYNRLSALKDELRIKGLVRK